MTRLIFHGPADACDMIMFYAMKVVKIHFSIAELFSEYEYYTFHPSLLICDIYLYVNSIICDSKVYRDFVLILYCLSKFIYNDSFI